MTSEDEKLLQRRSPLRVSNGAVYPEKETQCRKRSDALEIKVNAKEKTKPKCLLLEAALCLFGRLTGMEEGGGKCGRCWL